ncbi:MAG: discoidin domain-containing protein, partial [Anaerolineaceae bacterium]|nr:discoidin domain-containing protein [Anaerolineaceae bacterium]
MSVNRASEVWKEIKPFAIRDMNRMLDNKAGDSGDDLYAIILYDESAQKINLYSMSAAGLAAALGAADSGDIVWVPAGTIESISGDQSFISTVGAEKCISIAPAGELPSNWNEISFDDSAWDDSIAGDGYQSIISGTERVTNQTGDNPDQGIMLFRRIINISGPITEIKVKGDDYIDAVYLNGFLLFENGAQNTLGTINPDQSICNVGNNILAIKTRNSTQAPQIVNYMDLSYEITVGNWFVNVPEGVEIVGLGKNTIIDGSIENNGILTNIQITGTITGSGISRLVANPTSELFSNQIKSLIATGTAPFLVASTTLNTNLNADLLDGEHASAFADAAHNHTLSDITDFDGDSVLATIEEVGDLIYRKEDIEVYINRATTGQGASADAISAYGGQAPGYAIDENDATYWAATSNPVADDWIYVDLGQERTIHRFRLLQHDFDGAWGATSYKIQGGNNGLDWTDIITVNPSANDETIDFASPQSYQYFRFYALTGGGYSWDIFTIELLELTYVTDNDITRLPIGDESEILTVQSGIPSWQPLPSHSHMENDITDLEHDAEKIDGIDIDLTSIEDG